jgi:diguanylate cyclase (GGDEF)-like protein/PAS domain S-box-containing protein
VSDPSPHLDLAARLTDVLVGLDGGGVVCFVGASSRHDLDGHRDPTGRRFGTLVHPDDVVQWEEQLTKALADPSEVHRLTLRLTSGDGTWSWMDCLVVNHLDDPAVGLVLVSGRDVTADRETQEQLRRNEERLTTLAANSTDVLIVLDAEGVVQWVGGSVQRLFGYAPDDVLGRPGSDFIHPEDLPALSATLEWLTAEARRSRTTSWRARHQDDTWRWVEAVNVNLLEDPDVAGVVISLRDITERRRTEAALRESEARFRAVVQNSRDVTGLLDADGRIVWASPNVADMLGTEPAELVGRPSLDLVHPDDVEVAFETLQEVQASEETLDPLALRLAHRDGAWLPVEIAGGALRDESGELQGVILNIRDIAWRIEAEDALRTSEERFRALVQHSSDVVIVASPDGPLTYVSPSVWELFGHEPDDLLGTRGSLNAHPDDLEKIRARVGALRGRPGESDAFQYRVYDATGNLRWVESTVTNLVDEPSVQGFVYNVHDITDRVEAEQALRASEAMFRSVAESSPLGIYTADREGRCIYVNERWQQITGLTAEDAAGHGWVQMVHPDDLEWLLTDIGDRAFTERHDLTYRLVRPDGEVRWVTAHTSGTPDEGPDGVTAVGVMEDITDRVEAERDTQRLTDIFEATQDFIGIADAQGNVLYFNRAARRFFELPLAGPLADRNLIDVFSPWATEMLTTQIEPRLRRDGIWSGELALLRPDGTEVPVSAQLLVHYDDTGELEFFSGVMRDISERKAFEDQLAHQATHDPLTGLPNRILLLDELGDALARAHRHHRSVAVLFLDLDHFKVVNDSLGHGLGDRLLVSIARRLSAALRPGDTVGRFGGDEFVLICEQIEEPADAVAVARRVEHALSRPFEVDDAEIYVGVSVGISISEDTSRDPETLIRDADAAMYRAKEKGRARYEVFDSAMRASAVDRMDIENALRRSLDRRELRIHYQPIVELTSGRIQGVEALLRWEHPDRGLLLPGEFITIAEETGLIVPMGRWVLEQTCRQLQRWAAEHPETARLVATVNISGRQLSHPRLVPEVEAVLQDTGIDPSRLDLEITESVLMDDVEMSAATLQRLKALGVRLVVDDFGTGYSSLSYLRQFPVDAMKVDQSFVYGLGTDPGDSAIVAAIVSLAHTLGLQAVAEGVETPQQLVELRALACDYAQGFYMARPLTGDALLDLIRSDPRF